MSSSGLSRIRRRRLYEEVISALAEHVRAEGLSVGEKLPSERALAERLGVSRPSLKQALVVLEVQGLIETRHGGGSYLRSSDLLAGETLETLEKRRERLPEILDAREALEVKLASLAALRRDEADLRAVEEALEEMRSAIRSGGDVEAADAGFHAAVASAAHSEVLVAFMNQIKDDIAESRRESLRQPGRPEVSLAQHREVARYIRLKDGAGSEKAMKHHLRTVRDTQLLNWSPEP